MERTVIELFAGVGGFRVGLNNIKEIDSDGKAAKTSSENGVSRIIYVYEDGTTSESTAASFDDEEEDFDAFKALTKEMVDQFDGIEFHGGRINGELVVSENIADNGGMGVTLEIMHTLDNADYKAYFINWARVWCRKAKEEYIRLLLSNDEHSPAELRANMPPRNFSEWYETFGVTETDRMYLAPEDRISIW